MTQSSLVQFFIIITLHINLTLKHQSLQRFTQTAMAGTAEYRTYKRNDAKQTFTNRNTDEWLETEHVT